MDYCELVVPAKSFKRLVREHSSYRNVADEVARELRRKPADGKPQTCSHTLIAQLANGTTRNTHPARAAAIEQVLDRQKELFVRRLSFVARDHRAA